MYIEKILESIKLSSKKVEILPVEETVLRQISNTFKIKEDSLFGNIVLNTGGLVIDNWIRIYGAGKANFFQRNVKFPYNNLLVAEDILGGLFALIDNGNIGYFAPDTLTWEDNDLSYSEFIYWALHGDTDTYYQDYRWNMWQNDIENVDINNGVSFYPFLWAEEDSFEKRVRKEIPMEEIIQFQFDMASRLDC
ncbi:DUF2625 family protein [Terrisporobacter hibernicus]|uniref:DUF2625 domain-containing protein n=1 Tax=Terrisporobacter hibernicus TaxID=2813371 RepID=A0AAX2ZEP7_9FIRM|nr:DUF2625 family protein [Terrisporobacter hibernicus]UEL47291.1 DUF2625 domain-containing protein [Terrisporobacter hibernicus]